MALPRWRRTLRCSRSHSPLAPPLPAAHPLCQPPLVSYTTSLQVLQTCKGNNGRGTKARVMAPGAADRCGAGAQGRGNPGGSQPAPAPHGPAPVARTDTAGAEQVGCRGQHSSASVQGAGLGQQRTLHGTLDGGPAALQCPPPAAAASQFLPHLRRCNHILDGCGHSGSTHTLVPLAPRVAIGPEGSACSRRGMGPGLNRAALSCMPGTHDGMRRVRCAMGRRRAGL